MILKKRFWYPNQYWKSVRKIIVDAAKPYADSWRVDTMGNLFFTRKARGPAIAKQPLRVLVAAHMKSRDMPNARDGRGNTGWQESK